MAETLLDSKLTSESRVQLISKQTILICSFVTSPVMAGFLYASNLLRTGQKTKIFGSLILICISDVFVQATFMNVGRFFHIPSYILAFPLNLITGLFIISPLWKQHFSKDEYLLKPELKWLISAVILFYGAITCYLVLFLNSQKPWSGFVPNFWNFMSSYSVIILKFGLVTLSLIIAFFIRVFIKLMSAIKRD